MDNLDTLSSDGENAVKFVRNGEEAELELENKELMFQFCSDGCMDKVPVPVVACFDSPNPNLEAKGECGPGQCEFRAGVLKAGVTNYLWFASGKFMTEITDPNGICAKATMAYSYALVSVRLTDELPSCEPLKHDGNVVKLYILQAKRECPLYVLNAKKWSPPSTTKTPNTTETTPITTSKSSEANTTLWIGIGVGIFILLIVVIYLLIF
uniref:Transmembrane protein n=1 Tax=Panagrolaimus davidi TaxID=227884 RepID=A0A914NZB9_9BILA